MHEGSPQFGATWSFTLSTPLPVYMPVPGAAPPTLRPLYSDTKAPMLHPLRSDSLAPHAPKVIPRSSPYNGVVQAEAASFTFSPVSAQTEERENMYERVVHAQADDGTFSPISVNAYKGIAQAQADDSTNPSDTTGSRRSVFADLALVVARCFVLSLAVPPALLHVVNEYACKVP